MLNFIWSLLTYSLVTPGEDVQLAAFGITAIVIAVIAVVSAVTSATVSAEQAKANAKVQAKAANQKSRYEMGVALVENEQKRQQAATEVEEATIKGAKAGGAIQALGVGGRSLDRLMAEAKAMTLRDLSDIEKGFEFSRQNTADTMTGIGINRELAVTGARNEASAARTSAIVGGVTQSVQGAAGAYQWRSDRLNLKEDSED